MSVIGWPSDYQLKREGITYSLLTKFDKCVVSGCYAAGRYRKPGTTKSLAFGSLVHFLLERLYLFGTEQDIGTMISSYIKKQNDLPPGGWNGLIAQAWALAIHYTKYYATDWKEKKFVEAEETYFKVPFVDGFVLNGKIDAEFKDAQGVWLLETKTRSQINEQDIGISLALDEQSIFYCLMRKLKKGTYPKGVLYNVIRTPQIKMGVRDTMMSYRDRLIDDIAKRPEFYFKRWPIIYNTEEIDEYAHELHCKLWRLQEIENNAHPITRSRSACIGRYGICRYAEACAIGSYQGLCQTEQLFTELYE